jgi:hypothetical protein
MRDKSSRRCLNPAWAAAAAMVLGGFRHLVVAEAG